MAKSQKSRWAALGMACVASVTWAQAQSKDNAGSLRDALVHKQLFLRGFSADQVVRWSWDGRSLTAKPPMAHIAGLFVPDTVTVKDTKVEIHGLRYPLVKKKDGTVDVVTLHDPIEVQVDMKGADRVTLLSDLPKLLFYSSEQNALDDLQAMHQKIPTAEGPIPKPTRGAAPSNCPAGNVTEPKLIHQREPEFTDEARRQDIANATVVLSFKVDTKGRPEDVWIVRAVGGGLDENAAKSVLSYRFKPARCNGEPIFVDLYVEVSFTRY